MWKLLEGVDCSTAELGVLMAHAALLDAGLRLDRPLRSDGEGLHLTVLPADWRAQAPKYSFAYAEGFSMSAMAMDDAVHIHCSPASGDLLSVTLSMDARKEWKEKVQTHLLDKVLRQLQPSLRKPSAESPSAAPPAPAEAAEPSASSGPGVGDNPSGPSFAPPGARPFAPFGDPQRGPPGGPLGPYNPLVDPFGAPPMHVGPRDPRWGPGVPTGGPPAGYMPGARFDPVGPGGFGEPDNDVLMPPGMNNPFNNNPFNPDAIM